MEKRPKRRAAKEKTSANRAKRKKNQKLQEVRQEVLEMVEEHAQAMTQAVIDQAEEGGQLATVKYLLEAANILHPTEDEGEASKEEDSLAETLLERLNIPKVPLVKSEDAAPVETDASDGAGEKSESDSPKAE